MKQFYHCCIATALFLFIFPKQNYAQTPDLGVASSFAVFTAVGAFSNSGNSTIVTGDVGTNVGAFNAFPPGLLIGSVHVADPVSAEAAVDVADAYSYLAGLTCSQVIGPLLGGGQILTPGIYCIGEAASLTGNLILDAGGDPDAIFIFQINGALTTGTLANVVLINGASICNVWWQVNGSFSLGDGSTFRGNVLANGAISLLEGSNLHGRILSQAGAIDLHNNIVSIGLPAIAAVISADGPLSFCEGDSVILSGNIDGSWNNGSILSSITISESGNYFVINTTLCGSDTSNIIVVTVVDPPPVISCPSDITINCDAITLPLNTGTATAVDSCDADPFISYTDVIIQGNCPGNATIIRTWIATDIDGNSVSCNQTISIVDNLMPEIICAVNVTISCEESTLPDNTGFPVATDNCDANPFMSYSDQITPGLLCAQEYIITRLWVATDSCGNSSQCTQTITIEDNTPPVISCPADVIIMCNTSADPAVTGMATSLDNCDSSPLVTYSDVIGPSTCPVITRTWVATDACGNSSSCEQIITQSDSIIMTIVCPIDLDLQCADDAPLPDISLVIATSSCPGAVVITHSGDETTSGSCPDNLTVTRTYLATDACGNTATCVQIISIDDDTPPVITCPVNITVQCINEIPVPNLQLTASDNCGGIVQVAFIGDVISAQICPNQYTITRTYQATDACGNSTQCTQTIEVNDTTVPVIVCPANVTINCGESILPASTGTPIVSDNCNGVTIVNYSDILVPGDCPQEFVITRTWLVSDDCGNSANCEQLISVESNGEIIILCPSDVTVECASSVPPADPAGVQASAGCGTVTVSFVGDIITNMMCADQFILVRTYQAMDECGNSATCSQLIFVQNDILPVIDCPANLTVTCESQIPLPNPQLITGVSNCGDPLIINFIGEVVTNFVCNNNYTITRTYRATDGCGNSSECNQLITVFDDIPPSIVCPVNITVNCASNIPPANTNTVTSGDNCGGLVTVAFVNDVITNQLCSNQFTVIRTYRATDLCGNSSTCQQIITVFDNIIPSIMCPANITVACASAVPPVNTSLIISSDNCGGLVTVAFVNDIITNQVCSNQYTVVRTYRATDMCGNSSSCQQVITVFDNIPPSISCPANITVACASDVPAATTNLVTSSDNCGGLVTVAFVNDIITNQICSNQYTVIRTYRATDVCGNSSSCQQIITVFDNIPPAITFDGQPFVNGDTYQVQCFGQDPEWDLPGFDEGSVTVTDACSGEVTVDFNRELLDQGDCTEEGYINRYMLTWTASDECGNSSTAFVFMELVDTIPPVILGVPLDITVNCNEIPELPVLVYATDECLCACVIEVSETPALPGCQDGQVIVRTWSARDRCGNESQVSQRITLIDDAGPVLQIIVPEFLSATDGSVYNFSCNEGGIPAMFDLLDAASVIVTGECGGGASITFDMDRNISNNCAFFGFAEQQTYTWRAVDECGNVSSMVITARVMDDEAPVLLGVPAMACIGDPLDDIEAIDNCGEPTLRWWETNIPNPCGTGMAVSRTYEAIDNCGNAVKDTVILISNDQFQPTMEFVSAELRDMHSNGGDLVLECQANGGRYTTFGAGDILFADACMNGVTVDFEERIVLIGDCDTNDIIAQLDLVWTATDLCGNLSQLAIQATVVDNTGPLLVGFKPVMSISCGDALPELLATDNCGQVVISTKDSIITGTCEYQYSVHRQVTAVDACGNITTALQIINVGNGGLAFTGIEPRVCDDITIPVVTAYDGCAEVFVEVSMEEDTLDMPCGEGLVIERLWIAADLCGGLDTVRQIIVINDHTPPVILIPARSVINRFMEQTHNLVYTSQYDLIKQLNALHQYSVELAEDCEPFLTAVFTVDTLTGNCLEDGFIEQRHYTWTATDICGNATSISFVVDIIDDEPPVVSNVPSDTIIVCEPLPLVAVLVYTDDAQPLITQYTQTIEPGISEGTFIVTRTWIVTDACGNTTEVIQVITWIPESLLSCEIALPPVFECNSHGVQIGSIISGSTGAVNYEWEIAGEKCFIQGGQGTPEISIYTGWSEVKIILTITDTFGCVTMCMITVPCTEPAQAAISATDNITVSGLSQAFSKDQSGGSNSDQFNVWPNPARDIIQLSFESGVSDDGQIIITNYLNQFVHTDEMSISIGLNMHQLDLNRFPQGNYLIRLKTSGEIFTKVISIMK